MLRGGIELLLALPSQVLSQARSTSPLHTAKRLALPSAATKRRDNNVPDLSAPRPRPRGAVRQPSLRRALASAPPRRARCLRATKPYTPPKPTYLMAHGRKLLGTSEQIGRCGAEASRSLSASCPHSPFPGPQHARASARRYEGRAGNSITPHMCAISKARTRRRLGGRGAQFFPFPCEALTALGAPERATATSTVPAWPATPRTHVTHAAHRHTGGKC